MKTFYSTLLLLFSFSFAFSQVGINTAQPDPSAALDIKSENSGVLIPRMTQAQIDAIVNPASGLLTYNTDLSQFSYFDGQWNTVESNKQTRDNHVIVKSQADFPVPVAGVITLDTNTSYQLNGTIYMTNSLDMNNATIYGQFTQRDALVMTTTTPLFKGATGGTLRNIAIAGSPGISTKVFELASNPAGTNGPQNLAFQTIIINGAASVGTISGYGLIFFDIAQFLNNVDGITFSNTGVVLLNAMGWDGSNTGTFETFTGTFQLIEQQSGFMNVTGSNMGVDIMGVNDITGSAVIEGVVFYGGGNYIDGNSPYTGYNFTNDWSVDCPGLVAETDERATGNIYMTGSTPINITNNNAAKLSVTTTAARLFRTRDQNTSGTTFSNRIYYDGMEAKIMTTQVALAYTATGGSQFQFSLYKNGTTLVPGTTTIANTLTTNQNQSVSILGTVDMNPGDYIEVFCRKTSTGNEQFLTTSYNLILSN
ncbi:hypothetical protein [Nonlabens marinus]|nr:hypothetical protein [Nonlabens marinus]